MSPSAPPPAPLGPWLLRVTALGLGVGLGWAGGGFHRNFRPASDGSTVVHRTGSTRAPNRPTEVLHQRQGPDNTLGRGQGATSSVPPVPPAPSAFVSPADETMSSLLKELRGRTLQRGEAQVYIDMLDTNGEPGYGAMAAFLRSGEDLPLAGDEPIETTHNSLRYDLIRELGRNQTPATVAALGEVVRTSPALHEVLEAAFALRRWDLVEAGSMSPGRLQSLIQSALDQPAGDSYAQIRLASRVAIGNAVLGDGEIPESAWNLLKANAGKHELLYWSSAFGALPPAIQERAMKRMEGDWQKFEMTSAFPDHWPFSSDIAVQAATRIIRELPSHKRQNLLRSLSFTGQFDGHLSGDGSSGGGPKYHFDSEEERERYRRRLAGASRLFDLVEQAGVSEMEALQIQEQRRLILKRTAEIPDMPTRGPKETKIR